MSSRWTQSRDERLRPLLERTEGRLSMLAALALQNHRNAADAQKPFSAWGFWMVYSNRFYRAEDIRRALEKGE